MIGLKGRQYWEFASRLGVSLAVFGSAFALGSISLSTVRTVLDRKELAENDRLVRGRLDNKVSTAPIEKQIQDHETLLAELKDPISIADEQKNLAGMYSQFGRKSELSRRFPESEAAYQRALSLDPNNSDYMAALASLYNARAQQQQNPVMKVTLYQTSRQFFLQASERESRPAAAEAYSNNAAIATIGLARELRAAGRFEEATKNLKEAAEWAGPDVRRQINSMLYAE